MADVDLGSGYRGLAGVGKEDADAWGTLVAPAELLPFVSEDIKLTNTRAESNALLGQAGTEDRRDIIKEEVSGSLVCDADYQALDILLGLTLGGTVNHSGASDPYTQEFLQTMSDIQRSVSLAFDKRVEDSYVEGVKITEMVWSSTVDGVTVTFNVTGETISRGTTHQTTLRALSFTNGRRIYHNHATFRIADCADALAAGDSYDISEFEMVFTNNLATDHYGADSGTKISEQYRNGKISVTFRFVLRSYDANTFVNACDNDTKMQADIVYTGPTLGGGNYSLTMEFPTVKVISADFPISDEGLIQHTVECVCHNNNGNTNMSAIDEQIEMTVLNQRDAACWS
jgi:hypothetical protein